MATDQKQRLTNFIEIIQTWRASRLPDEILMVFESLEELDQKKDIELWDKLAAAITENKEFSWKPFQRYLEPYIKKAKEEHFWWKLIKR